MKALFLVGPPGVGKTAVAREIFAALDPLGSAFLLPKPKWTVATNIYAAAGHYTGATFDGADTVPYTGAMEALDALERSLAVWKPSLIVFDGDRFSYAAAEQRVRSFADTRVAYFSAQDATLRARRAARGSQQNATWLAGRATKAVRFAQSFPTENRLSLNAEPSPKELASAVLSSLRISAK